MMELCKNIVQLKIFDHFNRESPSKMLDRSSRPDMFCKKGVGVLRNFTKFTGKHLCQSLFFNKVAGLLYFLFSGFSDNFRGNRR